jgi:hypothetical protein
VGVIRPYESLIPGDPGCFIRAKGRSLEPKYWVFYKDADGRLIQVPSGATKEEGMRDLELEKRKHPDAYIMSNTQIKKQIEKERKEFESSHRRRFFIIKSKKTGRVIETLDSNREYAKSHIKKHYQNPEEYELVETGGY